MGLRKWAIAALAVLIVLSAMTPATAWLGSKRVVELGDMVFGVEYVIQKPSATLFHTENLAATDTEALAIAFPVDPAGNTVSPAIGQTVTDTVAASDSGFFKANWCYTANLNPGGYDLTPNMDTWHPMKSTSMVGSGVSWPYMDNAPLYGESTMTFKPAINTSPDTGNASIKPPSAGSGKAGLAATNISTGNKSSGTNNQTPYVSNGSSQTKPNRDYKNMTKTDIRNMNGLEKMYRNANMRNSVPQTYKGTVQRPTTIDPNKKPNDVIKPPNYPQVITDAINMTHDGKDLKTMFWDL
jgi:hypothetical protein